jgi:hypothetical protein
MTAMGDEKSVQGIRHPGRTWVGIMFGIIGILLMLSPVVWLVEFIRLEGYENNAGSIGSLWWPVLSVVLLLVGIYAINEGFDTYNLLESDCPCCGAHATRRFDPLPATCESCAAYLRADGDRVREEALEATGRYWVGSHRYLRTAKRTEQGRLLFQMPPICAICGSSDAHNTRDVVVDVTPSDSGPSWLGKAIVATSSGKTRRQMGLRMDGSVKTSGPSSPGAEDQLREELADVKVPVCSEHASGPSPLHCSDVSKSLQFTSYRYYKAFLALNP